MSGYPTPYKGSEPYIFISYSHRNTEEVLQIIQELINCGYRVWYDEGIDPGTEWDNNIAEHVLNCGYFIAMISDEYLASGNCRDEMQFARDENKSSLLIYLKDVLLPSGMRLRFGRLQAIHKYRYGSFSDFMSKVQETENLSKCKNNVKTSNPDAAKSVFTESGGLNHDLYDLYLTGFRPEKKISIIAEIRKLSTCKLYEAVAMINDLPLKITENVGYEGADAIQKEFLYAGGTVEMKRVE